MSKQANKIIQSEKIENDGKETSERWKRNKRNVSFVFMLLTTGWYNDQQINVSQIK